MAKQIVFDEEARRALKAAQDEYGDMVAKGIIDPAKVTRAALENAASIAAMVLTTETLVTDIPEKTETAAAAGHGHEEF